MKAVIDAHTHLDLYPDGEREALLASLPVEQVEAVIAVSMHRQSCEANLALRRRYPSQVFPAFGFHPEQPIPEEEEQNRLFDWIRANASDMVAVGEVGLPYYTRTEAEAGSNSFGIEPYTRLLDRFIRLAAELRKPIVLHAVYEDADIALGLLEEHGITHEAHFHWFKGSDSTVIRMIRLGCRISITPDVLYEDEIQRLVRVYPLELMMVETDGPWPFEGPFAGQATHPRMMRESIRKIAEIKGLSVSGVTAALYDNTRRFYRLF